MDELYPILLKRAVLAKRYDIGLNIDAEEADRLELSLDLPTCRWLRWCASATLPPRAATRV